MMNSESYTVTHTDCPLHQMKHLSASFQNFLVVPLGFSIPVNFAKTLKEGRGFQGLYEPYECWVC